MTNTYNRRAWAERVLTMMAGAVFGAALPTIRRSSATMPPNGTAVPAKTSMALSLRELQRRAGERQAAGKALPDELKLLGGLTEVHGFVISGSDDVVLFGARAGASVHIDDLAAGLTSAYPQTQGVSEPIGCTIDPRAGASDPWAIQDVRIFAQPCVRNGITQMSSRMAERHVRLDLEMKRAGAGLVSLDGVRNSFEAGRDHMACATGASAGMEVTSRFWFCALYPPDSPRFEVDEQSALINHPVGVQVLTEKMKLGAGRIGDADPAAQGFANDLTRLLASGRRAEYQSLVNDFRIIELGVLMRQQNIKPTLLKYLLQEHQHEPVPVPLYVAGVRRSQTNEIVCEGEVTATPDGVAATSQVYRQVLEYRGGVEARVVISDRSVTTSSTVAGIGNHVLQSRPAADSLVWEV